MKKRLCQHFDTTSLKLPARWISSAETKCFALTGFCLLIIKYPFKERKSKFRQIRRQNGHATGDIGNLNKGAKIEPLKVIVGYVLKTYSNRICINEK